MIKRRYIDYSFHFLSIAKGFGSVVLIACLLFLNGCIDNFDISGVEAEVKIVIEGRIENGKYAEVFVLRSNPLSSTDTSDYYKNAFVIDAKVFVSDGTTTEQLKFRPVSSSVTEEDSSYVYYFPYLGTQIKGVPGKSYSLTVIADGKTYTAITTIPTPVALDSVWWKAQAPYDTLGYAWAHLSEPAGVGNNYKWYAKRTNKWYAPGTPSEKKDRRYLAPLGSTFDDKFVDGQSFDFFFNRGLDASDTLTQVDKSGLNIYFKKTDMIFIKFCTIDQVAAKFFTTYEAASQSNGNPFASPVSIMSNIQGGGLGSWIGFGCTYDTIVPK